MEKIVLALDLNASHGHATETVWAERVGDGRFRLRSVPFYANGLGFGDIVNTQVEDGKNVVQSVSLRSGHSTYRAFIKDPAQVADELFNCYWIPLQEIGCTYERATEHLIAIDVPGNTDLDAAYALLEAGERAGVWEFEEGHSSRSGSSEL
jgi:hypothetical protein